MKEHPILFSGLMVRAILAGSKTQTRRVVKPQPIRGAETYRPGDALMGPQGEPIACPYGQVGDRLWVRETFALPEAGKSAIKRLGKIAIAYRADEGVKHGKLGQYAGKWRPSIYMPRRASRLTLEITEIRVERLQEISDGDCYDEGAQEWAAAHPPRAPNGTVDKFNNIKLAYRALWDSLNAKRGFGWDKNPFVWVVTFKRVMP